MYIPSIFAHVLRSIGIDGIVVSRRIVKRFFKEYKESTDTLLHRLVNLVILGRVEICRGEYSGVPVGERYGVQLLYDVRPYRRVEYAVVDRSSSCSEYITDKVLEYVSRFLPRIPLFIVDFSLWELHHEVEKNELFKQLFVLIDTVRSYLTDLHVVFVAMPSELRYRFPRDMPIKIEMRRDVELYRALDRSRTVVLDPYAEQALSEDEIFKFDAYILGGIVDDLFPRPYATRALCMLHGLEFERRSIRLWGSTIGVPNRLNKIVSIILDVRFNRKPLDQAIVDNMSVGDKIARVLHEVHLRFGKTRRVERKDIAEIMGKLKLDPRYMGRIISMLKDFEIVG